MKIAALTSEQQEKEFLNIIVYTEMKRRGMTDKIIMLHYNIRYSSLKRFKRQNGLNGKGRGQWRHANDVSGS